MSYFVAVFQEVPPDRLDAILAIIRSDYATSRTVYPGRRSSRTFVRPGQPCRLLGIGEWDSRVNYEQLRRSPRYQEVMAAGDAPARIEDLERLRWFVRMPARPAAVGCATLTATGSAAASLEAYILGPVRQQVEASPGLVSHEIYRIGGVPGHLLVVHGWSAVENLERFRAEDGPTYDAEMIALGTAIERFTVSIAAEFSALDT